MLMRFALAALLILIVFVYPGVAEEICINTPVVNKAYEPEYPYYTNVDSVVVDVGAYLIYTTTFPQLDDPELNPSEPPIYNGISISDFYAAFDTLSNSYKNYGISFNLVGIGYYGTDEPGQLQYNINSIVTSPSYISMFIGWPSGPDAKREGMAFTTPSRKFLVNGDGIQFAIAHEMGHCLGLHHTHASEAPEGICRDYPGPEDCDSCGDKVCDTPADPKLLDSFFVPGTCDLDTVFVDPPWNPQINNQMGYPPDGCREVFTPGQIFRVMTAIDTGWGDLASATTVAGIKEAPQISESAEFPIIAASQDTSTVIAVEVVHPHGYQDMTVIMDATNIDGTANPELANISLVDNGEFPDLVNDDGIYTSPPLDIDLPEGSYYVSIEAFAPVSPGSNRSYSEEDSILVLAEDTGLKFVDGSASTGELKAGMQGEPFSSTYFETQIEGSTQKILVLGKNNSTAVPEIFRRSNVVSGAPDMENLTSLWFGIGGTISGGRGVCVADFDNDGDEDLFVCNNGSSTKLYENTGTRFSDVTGTEVTSSGTAALQKAHLAAWGDYNQDGWIDLFVASVEYSGDMSDIGSSTISASPTWSLFRNTGDGFELTSGILYATPTESAISATWNDIDCDGDLDLLVGYIDGTSDNNPRVFENQGFKKLSGDFVLEDKSSTKGVPNLSINSLDWIDYNHDEYPDLLVTAFSPQQGALLLKNVADTSGRKFVVAENLTTEGQWEGASVGDLDQNGEEDIVLLPHSGIPAVYLATPGLPAPSYMERAFTLGVKPTSGSIPAFTSGGIVADFNDDHDLDLYLGRPKTDQFLYRNMRQDGTSDQPAASGQNWVDIDLATLGNANYSLIGAKITVEDPSTGMTWMQVIDGGSGRGGQKANQLHFGLGSIDGPMDVRVDWPSGGFADTTGLSVNVTHLITENSQPEINSSGLAFSHEPFPGGGADWVFEWITDFKGDIRHDKVELRYEPGYGGTSNCTLGAGPVIEWGDSGVEMSVEPVLLGWKHKVVLKNQFCSGSETCHFQFKATSGLPGYSDSSSWINFGYFDLCVGKNPIPQQ